jgi:alkanesulfonate monooxygenase SsuD/methylene tetrahydromethanopterin reductase-like flavin-dependent oxidoreductase (luciferase family)
MKLSVMVHRSRELDWDDWVAVGRAADEAGFDGVYAGDHYLAAGGTAYFDAWTVFAALAAVTERVRLGTLVTPVTFRAPAVLAQVVTTVDHVSGGRADLGLGAGNDEREHAHYALPFPPLKERMDLLAEQLELLTRHFAETEPATVQRPRPRIVLSGAGKRRSLSLAARYADEYCGVVRTPDEMRELRAAVDAAGGPHLELSLAAVCVVSDDEAFLEPFRRAAAGGANRLGRGDETRLVGSLDEVAARLDEYAAAGVDKVYLRYPADEQGLDALRLVGRELVPALA